MNKLLIVFVKHPKLGRAKTRLAATIGDEKALLVYKALLDHTKNVCQAVDADVKVYYTDKVIENDRWKGFQKQSQKGVTLGERMYNALADVDYKRKVIIGSDCFDLTVDHINKAFDSLKVCDTVLGPANDGGYYLFGMNEVVHDFFLDIEWSTNKVLAQTVNKINLLNKSHYLLETLVDIDTEEDLKTYKNYEQIIFRNN